MLNHPAFLDGFAAFGQPGVHGPEANPHDPVLAKVSYLEWKRGYLTAKKSPTPNIDKFKPIIW